MLFKNAILITLAFALFSIPHSLMASATFKGWLAARIETRLVDGWYRLAYNVVALLLLLPALVLAATLPDHQLYRIGLPWSVFMVAVQIVGVVGVVVSLTSTQLWHFVGLTQAVKYLLPDSGREEKPALTITGLYKWVRHPLYLSSLLALWPIGTMTLNLLIFNIAASLYFALGSLFEERRLVKVFGDEYIDYQKRVPWLLPWPRK